MAKEQWAIYDLDGDLVALCWGPKTVAEQSIPAEAVGEILLVTEKEEPDVVLDDVPKKKPKTHKALRDAVKAKIKEHTDRVKAAAEAKKNAKAD